MKEFILMANHTMFFEGTMSELTLAQLQFIIKEGNVSIYYKDAPLPTKEEILESLEKKNLIIKLDEEPEVKKEKFFTLDQSSDILSDENLEEEFDWSMVGVKINKSKSGFEGVTCEQAIKNINLILRGIEI